MLKLIAREMLRILKRFTWNAVWVTVIIFGLVAVCLLGYTIISIFKQDNVLDHISAFMIVILGLALFKTMMEEPD